MVEVKLHTVMILPPKKEITIDNRLGKPIDVTMIEQENTVLLIIRRKQKNERT